MNGFISILLNLSLAGAIAIIIAIVLRIVLKRAPKWTALLLWTIIGVRLVCPFFIGSEIGILPGEKAVDSFISGRTAIIDKPNEQTPTYTVGPHVTVFPNAGSMSPAVSAQPSSQEGQTVQNTLIPNMTEDAHAYPATASGTMRSPVHWQTIVFYVWLAGAFAVAFYAIVSWLTLKRRLSTAVMLKENVFQSEFVKTPFLFGLIAPRIYVPYGIDECSMEHVVSHEKAHIAHSDQVLKLIGFAVLAIHWFNPLCWLAYALFCKDLELACDERVIKHMNAEERAAYSSTLLSLSVDRRRISACPLAFGEGGVKARIRSILNYRKPAAWAIAFAMLLCALLASLSACRRDGTEQDPEGTPLPTAEAAVTEAPSETPAPTAAITAKPASTPVPAVEFKSAAIEAQVREQLKIGQDKAITSQMLMGLEHVYLHGEEITDLSDIRKFVGAEVISIASAPNADFAEFDAPSILKELSIKNCGLTDVSFISNIPSLTILDLSDNEIEDVSPIAGLRQLKYLQLENNRISDVSPLMEMRGLSSVSLSFNPIPLEQISALSEVLKRYGGADDAHVSFYTGDPARTACWPMDLNDDGEDEYFCVRLDWLEEDFVSLAWLESAEGRRLSDIMYCGTGHVAYNSFALVENPEYGTCLMRLWPEFFGEIYGFSLMKLVDGKLQSVYDERFYYYDGDGESVQSYDPGEAEAYQREVRELISSGTVLISTDAYGLLIGELVEVTENGERVFTPDRNSIWAVICTHGIIGTGVDYLKNCEHPDRYVIVEGRLLYNIAVEPYTGEN